MSRKTPEQKIMEAVFGKNMENKDEVMAKYYERQAANVTDEDFKRVWGVSIEEHTQKMMRFVGWCNAVTAWMVDRGVADKKLFNLRELVNLAEYFYAMGRVDEHDGRSLDDRFWPKKEQE